MSDSDSDYIDIHENDKDSESSDSEKDTALPEKSSKGRGKDIQWIEIARYASKSSYEDSGYFHDIKKYFTMRKGRESEFSDTEHFTCKFSRKRGFLVCPLQYKIHFLSTSEEVVVMTNTKSHVLKENSEYVKEGPNFHWTSQQTDIVMTGVKNEASAKVIKRNLQDSSLFVDSNFPTTSQLNAKIAYCRSIIRRSIEIFDTHQLRQKIAEKLDIPSDEKESYIAYHHVDDEDESGDPHFCIIWTSRRLSASIAEDFTQDDATYRLTLQGYPLFVSGRSSPTGKLFPTHVTLASNEDTRSWACSYKFVKNVAAPRYNFFYF